MHKITIAIDGYSSCGKSTLAKDIAHRLDYIYIDTGAMYRAVTLYCLKNKSPSHYTSIYTLSDFWKKEDEIQTASPKDAIACCCSVSVK